MSIHNDTNINIQTNYANDVGTVKGLESHAKNEALGNVHSSSKLAIAGRIVLGILTLGISEGIRAIVKHVSARPAAAPRINVQPQANPNVQPEAPRVDRRKSKFDFTAMEEKLGRPMKEEELREFSRIEQGLRKEKDGKTRIKEFQSKVMTGLDTMKEFGKAFENNGTLSACQNILMSHPELASETKIQANFFKYALFGTFDLLQKMDLGTTPAKTIATTLQAVATTIRYTSPIFKDSALKEACFKLHAYAQIEMRKMGSAFRALSDEKINEIEAEIRNAPENSRSKVETEQLFQILKEVRNSGEKPAEE